MGGISTNTQQALVVFDHISKYFNKASALDNISFSIPQGSVFGIIGPNGAGKSTMLKILIGFMQPSEGKIYINNKNALVRTLEMRHNFGYASQKNCFYPELTVEENLRYFGKLYWLNDIQIRKRTRELTNLVGLTGHGDVAAKYLSGGMQRKLDVACAIIHAPKILILDEPVAGIDSLSAKQLWKILRHINKLGTTIIVSSHKIEDMDDVCSDIIILNEGKIIERGNPKKLKTKHTKESIINLMTDPPSYNELVEALKEEQAAFSNHIIKDNKLLLYTPTPEKLVVDVVRHVVVEHKEIIDLDIRQPTLTEIFEKIIQENSTKVVSEEEDYDQLKDAVKQAMDNEYVKIKEILRSRKVPDHIIDKVLQEVAKK